MHCCFTSFIFWHPSALSLNGTQTGNNTEKFVGFIIYVHNEFEDEESGHFVKPLPQGVSMTECHFHEDPRADSVRCFLFQVIRFLSQLLYLQYLAAGTQRNTIHLRRIVVR